MGNTNFEQGRSIKLLLFAIDNSYVPRCVILSIKVGKHQTTYMLLQVSLILHGNRAK